MDIQKKNWLIWVLQKIIKTESNILSHDLYVIWSIFSNFFYLVECSFRPFQTNQTNLVTTLDSSQKSRFVFPFFFFSLTPQILNLIQHVKGSLLCDPDGPKPWRSAFLHPSVYRVFVLGRWGQASLSLSRRRSISCPCANTRLLWRTCSLCYNLEEPQRPDQCHLKLL